MSWKDKTILNWSMHAFIMLLFLTWHGAFERPLSDNEIHSYLFDLISQSSSCRHDPANMSLGELEDYIEDLGFQNRISQTEVERLLSLAEFLKADDGQPIVMVNLIKQRELPIAVNGRNFGESSEEALKNYGRSVLTFLVQRGSYPIFQGPAAMNVLEAWGVDNAEDWSSVILVRYRSRRVMMDLATSSIFQNSHDGKFAGIEKTIAVPTQVNITTTGLDLMAALTLLVIGLGIQLHINRESALQLVSHYMFYST